MTNFDPESLHSQLLTAQLETEKLRKGLEFYGDPETYFAIGFLPDPPCGEFINDGSDTELGVKPGKLARSILKEVPQGNVGEILDEVEKGLVAIYYGDRKNNQPCPDGINGCAINHFVTGRLGLLAHEALEKLRSLRGEG